MRILSMCRFLHSHGGKVNLPCQNLLSESMLWKYSITWCNSLFSWASRKGCVFMALCLTILLVSILYHKKRFNVLLILLSTDGLFKAFYAWCFHSFPIWVVTFNWDNRNNYIHTQSEWMCNVGSFAYCFFLIPLHVYVLT